MPKDEKKIGPLADDTPNESPATDGTTPPDIAAELDEEEKEFRALRRDLPGDKGRLIDSTEHPLFLKWAARDIDK